MFWTTTIFSFISHIRQLHGTSVFVTFPSVTLNFVALIEASSRPTQILFWQSTKFCFVSLENAKGGEKFELTQDYIQQTIQQALKKDNLSPEIEQKLLALQQHNEDGNIKKKSDKMIDPASGEPMDDEWDGATSAERSIAHKNRRKKQEEAIIAERLAKNTR